MHVNFTKGGDWVMQSQINSVQVAVENFTKKKRRCNSAAWLQIFGGVSAIGGIITAIATGVTGGLWLAVVGTGTFLTGWYKDSHSLAKLFCGTSKQQDMIYDAQKRKNKERKKEEKINLIKSLLDEVGPRLGQNLGVENAENISLALKAAKKYLKYKAPNYEDENGSLLARVRDVRNRFNNEQQLFINSDQEISH